MKRVTCLVVAGLVATVGVGTQVTTAAKSAAAAETAPTFAKDVAPIIFNNCATCHRPGEIGPMPLLSYENARPWAKAIKEKVKAREMPPWGADAGNSMKMRNDRSLTQQQIDTIAAWADGGAPKGDDKDLPALPKFATGWQNGEPDYIFDLPVEAQIDPEGLSPYLYYYDTIKFSEDKWAQSLEIRPSNFAVVHHSGAYIVELPEGASVKDGVLYNPDGSAVSPTNPTGKPGSSGEEQPLNGASKLISYVPGRGIENHPDGFAKRIPAGKTIRWVMHYNPTGKPEVDKSRLGIWYAKVPVHHEVLNLQAGDPVPGTKGAKGLYFAQGAEVLYQADDTTGRRGKTPTIPPYVDNFKMVGITPVNEPITLYSLTPHMHLRGKSMKWVVTWPDGKEETILDVPKYDFNWQIQYELEKPLHVPAGSKITATAIYDNSVKNKWNPGPQLEVYWSEQSWDEMFQPTTQFSVDSQDLLKMKTSTTQQQQQQ